MQYRKISISVLDNKSGDSIVGALVGYIKESNVTKITVKDSEITEANNFVCGVFGKAELTRLQNVHNVESTANGI